MLDPFEIKVMKLALRGEAPWIVGMRNQIPYLTVTERQSDAGGFTTKFHCSDVAIPVEIPRGEGNLPVSGYPPAINAKRSEPAEGLVSFIVWLGDDGRIRQLEACSLMDDKWPIELFNGFFEFQDDSGNIVEE